MKKKQTKQQREADVVLACANVVFLSCVIGSALTMISSCIALASAKKIHFGSNENRLKWKKIVPIFV